MIRVKHERVWCPTVMMAVTLMHLGEWSTRVQEFPMDVIGQDFSACIQPADMLDDLPRQGQSSRSLEQRSLEKCCPDNRQSSLHGSQEQQVENCKKDLPGEYRSVAPR